MRCHHVMAPSHNVHISIIKCHTHTNTSTGAHVLIHVYYNELYVFIICVPIIWYIMKKEQWKEQRGTAKRNSKNNRKRDRALLRGGKGTAKGTERNSKGNRKRKKETVPQKYWKRNKGTRTGTVKKRRSGQPFSNALAFNKNIYVPQQISFKFIEPCSKQSAAEQ